MLNHLISQEPLIIYLFGAVLVLVLMCAIGMRFVPHPIDKLHANHDPLGPMDEDIQGGFQHRRLVPVDEVENFVKQIDKTIRRAPRTKFVAGSLESGRMTYLSRTAIWASPNYTTLAVLDHPDEPEHKVVLVRGHAMNCESDLGESRDRILSWMQQVDA